MKTDAPPSLTICMGSSCFARGNSRNIEVIRDYLASRALPPGVELIGHLCEGQCKVGPNITINQKTFHEVDPLVMVGLLNHHLARGKP